MKTLKKAMVYGPLIARHSLAGRGLARRPEPSQATESYAAMQYNSAWKSHLAVLYTVLLEVIYRTRDAAAGGSAVDLACGPGHLTLALQRFLRLQSVLGIDLSGDMVALARENALWGIQKDRVSFEVGDVLDLSAVPSHSTDLAVSTLGMHHLADLTSVVRLFENMERITRPQGVIVAADLVRLKDERTTRRYIQLFGRALLDQGLDAFFDDFEHSMYAAWTAEELGSTLPAGSERVWHHLVPRGLPALQIVVGLPVGREKLFARRGLPWRPADCPVPKGMRFDWRCLRGMVRFAKDSVRRPIAIPRGEPRLSPA